MARRLPVFFLLDVSESMIGEPIVAVNNGVRTMLGKLRRVPHAMETVNLSLVTFDRKSTVMFPLTPLEDVQFDDLEPSNSGPTHLGEGLKDVLEMVDRDVLQTTASQRGDWQPFLFVMTDGRPSDIAEFDEQVKRITSSNRFREIIGCAAGASADTDSLARFCTHVAKLDELTGAAIAGFFTWVSWVISGSYQIEADIGDPALPPALAGFTFID